MEGLRPAGARAGLHRKGLIADPVGKAKSVALTDEGLQRSGELLAALFGKNSQG